MPEEKKEKEKKRGWQGWFPVFWVVFMVRLSLTLPCSEGSEKSERERVRVSEGVCVFAYTHTSSTEVLSVKVR